MNGQHTFDCLYFDEDQFIDERIDTKFDFDLDFAIMNRQRHLRRHTKGPASQFVGQALLLNRLEKARPECLMHRESRVDDLTRDLVMFGRQLNHLCALASWRFKANGTVSA